MGLFGPSLQERKADELGSQAMGLVLNGNIRKSEEMRKEALSYADQALELNPSCYNALQVKVIILIKSAGTDKILLSEVLQYCDRALGILSRKPTMWFNRAGILERLERFSEALEAYDKAGSFRNQDLGVSPLIGRGRVLRKLQRYDEALQIFSNIPQTEKYWGEAMVEKARILKMRGQISPTHIQVGSTVLYLFQQGEYQNALECLDIIQEGDPTLFWALFYRAKIQFELYNCTLFTKDAAMLVQAERCIDTLIAQGEPIYPNYLILKGRCRFESGHPEESLPYFDRVLELEPAHEDAVRFKITALKKLERYQEALDVCDRIAALRPDDPGPWFEKAKIRSDTGENSLGLNDIDQMIRLDPGNWAGWKFRAIFLRKLGQTAAAEEADQHARECSKQSGGDRPQTLNIDVTGNMVTLQLKDE